MDAPNNSAKSAEKELYTLILQEMPVAYVRPVNTENGIHYAVCTADGTQLATFPTQDGAYFAAKQHDLEPVLIH